MFFSHKFQQNLKKFILNIDLCVICLQLLLIAHCTCGALYLLYRSWIKFDEIPKSNGAHRKTLVSREIQTEKWFFMSWTSLRQQHKQSVCGMREWCWVGNGLGYGAYAVAVFFVLPLSRDSSQDAIESSTLRTLHWTWCAWSSDRRANEFFSLGAW